MFASQAFRFAAPKIQARSHGGGHFGTLPPAKAQSPPPAKISEINPILVTLKAYFLVFNTSLRVQHN